MLCADWRDYAAWKRNNRTTTTSQTFGINSSHVDVPATESLMSLLLSHCCVSPTTTSHTQQQLNGEDLTVEDVVPKPPPPPSLTVLLSPSVPERTVCANYNLGFKTLS
jgi:hypothetical protein